MSPKTTGKNPKRVRPEARRRAKSSQAPLSQDTNLVANETPAAEATPKDAADTAPSSATTVNAPQNPAQPGDKRAQRRSKPKAQSPKAKPAPPPDVDAQAQGDASADHRAASTPTPDAETNAPTPTAASPAIDSALSLALRRTSRADRVRHLIVLDAQSVVRRLNAQLSAMIELFSRHRDRDPLLAPLRSWLPGATFDALAELEPDEQRATAAFLEELEALRWYCRYTSDMPNTAQQRLTRFASQLEIAADRLIRALRPTVQPKHSSSNQ